MSAYATDSPIFTKLAAAKLKAIREKRERALEVDLHQEAVEKEGLTDEELRKAEEARLSFRSFIPYAWEVIEPGTAFIPAVEIDVIADHLEAVTRGQIVDLLVNVRPRSSKSRICSILWPVWDWLQDASSEFLTGSFDLGGARDSCGLSRLLIESQWFRARYGDRFALRPDKRAESWYRTTRGGSRRIASPKAGTTGRGGNRLLLDDPHDTTRVESKKERHHTINWWRKSFGNRGNQKATPRIVLGQRSHNEDLFSYLLKEGGWEHLKISTEYHEGKPKARTSIWVDPREREGEMLANPERFGHPENERSKIELGPADYAAQQDQEPSPDAGTVFQLKDFRRWAFIEDVSDAGGAAQKDLLGRDVLLVPKPGPGGAEWSRFFDDLLFSWDFTFKGEEGRDVDWVVGQLWGRKQASFVFLHQVRARIDFAGCLVLMTQTSTLYSTVLTKLVEAKANGDGIVSMLDSTLLGMQLVDPGAKSKVERARAISPLSRAGNVYVPADEVSWGEDSTVAGYLEELRTFPRGDHDDQVDATSQALLRLFRGYRSWIEASVMSTGEAPEDARLILGVMPS